MKKKKECIYIYKLNHFAVQQKLTQHHNSTMLQFKKKSPNIHSWSSASVYLQQRRLLPTLVSERSSWHILISISLNQLQIR